MPGWITDISVSRNGLSLVATVPNPDGEPPMPQLLMLSASGKRLWQQELKSRVRSLALSETGELAYVSAYNETVTAYSAQGRELWSVNEMCRPIPLGSTRRMLCFFDDDSRPNFAFQIFDANGQKLYTHPVSRDVLTLKTSRDGRWITYALAGGIVVLMDQEFKTHWRRELGAEVVGLDVSSGDQPSVVALSNPSRALAASVASRSAPSTQNAASRGQQIVILGLKNEALQKVALDAHAEQIAVHASGQTVVVYGNNPQGQQVTLFAPGTDGKTFERKWQLHDKRYADFSSTLFVSADQVIVGFEDIVVPEAPKAGKTATQPMPGAGSAQRLSHLFGFGLDGKARWDLPIQTDEGAYLYVQAFSAEERRLVVATDEGALTAYRLP